MFNDSCDNLEVRYKCCEPNKASVERVDEFRPWMAGQNKIPRRKRRAYLLNSSKSMNELLVEHELAVSELKYESRLEFGTGSLPSEADLWEATKKILVDGLPPQPLTPKPTPRSLPKYPRPNPIIIRDRCGNYYC